MSKKPENVEKLHENVRDSAEGVEEQAVDTEGEPAAGLIGNGMGVDPRLTAQR